MGLGEASGIDHRHVFLSDLYLLAAVVGAVAGEDNLQASHRFQAEFEVDLGCARENGGGCLVGVSHNPSAAARAVHETLACETEGEIQTRRHGAVAAALAEHVANIRQEEGQGEIAGVAPAQRHTAQAHGQACGMVGDFGPESGSFCFYSTQCQAHGAVAAVEHLDGVFVERARAQIYRGRAVDFCGVDIQALCPEIVAYDDRGVGFKCYGLLEASGFPFCGHIAAARAESGVDALEP